jgi:hypothetical protein
MKNLRILMLQLMGLMLLLGFLYSGLAFTIFQFRNPKANKLTYWSEFGSVMKMKKLERFQ